MYATEGRKGFIEIKVGEPGYDFRVISRETDKQEAYHKMEILQGKYE